MDLKNYLADVECLEKEKYSFECIIGSIDKKIRELEKPCVVYKKGNSVFGNLFRASAFIRGK